MAPHTHCVVCLAGDQGMSSWKPKPAKPARVESLRATAGTIHLVIPGQGVALCKVPGSPTGWAGRPAMTDPVQWTHLRDALQGVVDRGGQDTPRGIRMALAHANAMIAGLGVRSKARPAAATAPLFAMEAVRHAAIDCATGAIVTVLLTDIKVVHMVTGTFICTVHVQRSGGDRDG